jgi:predicted RNA-binding Zn ribbon-like protein
MTGERATPAASRSVQPGGRAPAPGELALIQAFVNTHYDLEYEHGAELLCDPQALETWLRGRGLLARSAKRLGAAELERALATRERLRRLARGNGPGRALGNPLAELNRLAAGAAVEVRFTPSGPRFVAPRHSGFDGALGRLFAITAASLIDGSWQRLKVCPGSDCGWAFYDHSRNMSGRWCSMAVCGGRAKARTHYRRHKDLR